jgi:single-stranded DNA-binding protein
MIKAEIIGFITKDAEIKATPTTGKEYAYFVINTIDEKEKESFVKCFFYGCSKKRSKTLIAGKKIIVWGKMNLSLFDKQNGEKDININVNVDDIHLI